jgi:hypothetical protein
MIWRDSDHRSGSSTVSYHYVGAPLRPGQRWPRRKQEADHAGNGRAPQKRVVVLEAWWIYKPEPVDGSAGLATSVPSCRFFCQEDARNGEWEGSEGGWRAGGA